MLDSPTHLQGIMQLSVYITLLDYTVKSIETNKKDCLAAITAGSSGYLKIGRWLSNLGSASGR